MEIDFSSMSLVALAIIGVVNVITMFKADLDSKYKFAISVVVALLVGFIPTDLTGELQVRISEALMAAFAASGAYKLSQKVGGQ